jgi:hypothetical protein
MVKARGFLERRRRIADVWKKPMNGWSKEEWRKNATVWEEEDRRIFHAIRLAGCPEGSLLIDEEE